MKWKLQLRIIWTLSWTFLSQFFFCADSNKNDEMQNNRTNLFSLDLKYFSSVLGLWRYYCTVLKYKLIRDVWTEVPPSSTPGRPLKTTLRNHEPRTVPMWQEIEIFETLVMGKRFKIVILTCKLFPYYLKTICHLTANCGYYNKWGHQSYCWSKLTLP